MAEELHISVKTDIKAAAKDTKEWGQELGNVKKGAGS